MGRGQIPCIQKLVEVGNRLFSVATLFSSVTQWGNVFVIPRDFRIHRGFSAFRRIGYKFYPMELGSRTVR